MLGDWLSVGAIIIALIGGGFGLWQNHLNRGDAAIQRRTPAPPTTVEVWSRLDRIEIEMRALLGVVYDVAEQQPGWKPKLDPEHKRILGDKLPMEWRERV